MLERLDRIYVNDQARALLGWEPRYDFRAALERRATGEDPRSPLVLAVGAQGLPRRVLRRVHDPLTPAPLRRSFVRDAPWRRDPGPVRPLGNTSPMEHILTPSLAAFEDRWHFSHVVASRGLLLLSGVTGTGVDGRVATYPGGQFEQSFTHLRLCLEAAGASLDDVVEMTSYHVGLRKHLDEFMAVKDRHIAEPYPAWSAIGVSELITEGALVEIRAIATDPKARP